MLSENSTANTQARAFSFFAFSGNLGIFLGPLIGNLSIKLGGSICRFQLTIIRWCFFYTCGAMAQDIWILSILERLSLCFAHLYHRYNWGRCCYQLRDLD